MGWFNKILGLPEKCDSFCAQPAPEKLPPCDEQKLFIHSHWDEFPEKIQEHIKRHDQIEAVSKERDHHFWRLSDAEEKTKRCAEIFKSAKEMGYTAYGLTQVVREYESRIKESHLKLMDLPDLDELRGINYAIEKEMEKEGWKCSYGTGGIHWNKKGVVEDGYGVYDK